MRQSLKPIGVIIPNSGHSGMSYVLKSALLSLIMRKHGRLWIMKPGYKDLDVLKGLIGAGKMKPVLDSTYPFDETPRAIGYVAKGHARGKVVITMGKAD